MNHTKRSIMIPEDHYIQLTKLISGNDRVQIERVKTDQQIQKILKSRLSELVKNVRYNSLDKKRKSLNLMINKKPTETVVEMAVKSLMKELAGKQASKEVSATGIVPTVVPKPILQEIQHQQQRVNIPPPRTPKHKIDQNLEEEEEEEETMVAPDSDDDAEEEAPKKKSSSLEKNINTVKKVYGKINKSYYDDLKKYLAAEDSLWKFGISTDGKIYSNISEAKAGYGKPFPGSDVNFVIRILVGRGTTPEKPEQLKYIISFLKRILKDDTIKQMLNNEYKRPNAQDGEGKRKVPSNKKQKNIYVLDLRKRKPETIEPTKGLERQRKNNRIKPKLWTKIRV